MDFRCKNIILGHEFSSHAAFLRAGNYAPRKLLSSMQKFTSYEKNVIGILFGLRRTGKTVLLYQWLLDLPKAKSAYLSLCADESFADLLHDLEVLRKNGYQYLAPLMKSPFVKILLTERLFLSTDFHLLA